MKLLYALLISLGLEAYTYHSSINFIANNISFALGINNPQAAIITTAAVALVKLVLIFALINIDKSKGNLLVILLAMCALFDCFLITLFLNSSMYAILFNISNVFEDIYRGVEVVCIVRLLFDVVRFRISSSNLHSSGSNRNSTRGSIRLGDKI